jgi:hypothetical protein
MYMEALASEQTKKEKRGDTVMAGRGKTDKSERRNNHPAARPSDLDQFGAKLRDKKMAQSPPITEDPNGNG